MATTDWQRLPFEEQIRYFGEKLNVPTDSYRDISGAEHDAAFVVAGAKGAVLNDLRKAVDRAIAEGTTLEQFRKEFEDVVQRTGWAFRGGSAWRSQVIWDTNLRTSYAAGRHEQMQAVATTRPYWQWRHGGSAHPRPQHLALDGRVFAATDPFWQSFGTPPQGYGCFPDGTEVLTGKGWRSIEKVCVGDLVMTGSGDLQPVIATHPRHYSGQLTRLHIGKDRRLTSTPDHRLLTLRGWVKAGNIQPGDVLVQIPQVAAFDESVADIEQSDALGADCGVTVPTQPPLRTESFQANLQGRQIDIDPVRREALVVNTIQPVSSEEVNQPLFALSGDSLGVGVLFGEVSVFDPPDSRLLGFNLRPSGGSRHLELLRFGSESITGLLGFTKPGVPFPFPVPSLMLPVSSLHDASVGVALPLSPHGLAWAEGQPVVFQEPHDSPVVHAPSVAELANSQALLDVEEPEGFVWGHPLGLFDSLEDFVAWARSHCHLTTVNSSESLLYIGNVNNLSVLGHESYCLRDVVAHNCRCSVFTLSDRDLERRGLTVDPGPQLGDRLPIPDLPGQTTAMNPPAGWGHIHGSSTPESRARLLDNVTRRLDPAIAAQVRREAAAFRASRQTPPSPALPPHIQDRPGLTKFGASLSVQDYGADAVARHLADLDLIPPNVAEALSKEGVQIVVGNVGMGGFVPKLKGVRPRGWPAGSTWDDIAGAYDSNTKTVYAGAGRSGSTSTVLHEFGHAVGTLRNYDNDPRLIDVHVRIYNGKADLNPYYKQGGAGGDAGRQELFAESFAAVLKDREYARAHFNDEVVALIDEILAEIQP